MLWNGEHCIAIKYVSLSLFAFDVCLLSHLCIPLRLQFCKARDPDQDLSINTSRDVHETIGVFSETSHLLN